MRFFAQFSGRTIPFLVIATLMFAISINSVHAEGVRWMKNVEEAKKIAASTNRLVLIHFWGTWCPPCRLMEEKVFSSKEIAHQIDANYVGVKLLDSESKKLRAQLGVDSFPTDVIMTPEGKVLFKMVGFRAGNKYIAALDNVANNHKPINNTLIAANTPPVRKPLANNPPKNVFSNNPVATNPVAATQPKPSFTPPTKSPAGDRYANRDLSANPFASKPFTPPVRKPLANNPPKNVFSNNPVATNPVAATQPKPSFTPPAFTPPAPKQPAGGQFANPVKNPALAANSGIAPSVPKQEPPAKSALELSLPPGAPPLAMEGFCPVQLYENNVWARGDVKYGAIHRGKLYLFPSTVEQKRFLATPEKYSPVASGDDPVVAVEQGRRLPGSRKYGVKYNNQIYLFSSEETLTTFESSPERFTADVVNARLFRR